MFGYIALNTALLERDRADEFRRYYCGLCVSLKKRYGQPGRITLSNDMTFLTVLLDSLYMPDLSGQSFRCGLHPIKPREYYQSDIIDYAADMNILLAYYKALDDKNDDGRPIDQVKFKMLAKAFEQVNDRYPDKCAAVQNLLHEIGKLESAQSTDIDALCRLTGLMLAEIFAYRKDHWEEILRRIGYGLGAFIYYMDAYEDYGKDIKKNRFNPLKTLHAQPDYEDLCKATMTMILADVTESVDLLPLIRNIDILNNVLYSGVWAHYARMHKDQILKKEHTNE